MPLLYSPSAMTPPIRGCRCVPPLIFQSSRCSFCREQHQSPAHRRLLSPSSAAKRAGYRLLDSPPPAKDLRHGNPRLSPVRRRPTSKCPVVTYVNVMLGDVAVDAVCAAALGVLSVALPAPSPPPLMSPTRHTSGLVSPKRITEPILFTPIRPTPDHSPAISPTRPRPALALVVEKLREEYTRELASVRRQLQAAEEGQAARASRLVRAVQQQAVHAMEAAARGAVRLRYWKKWQIWVSEVGTPDFWEPPVETASKSLGTPDTSIRFQLPSVPASPVASLPRTGGSPSTSTLSSPHRSPRTRLRAMLTEEGERIALALAGAVAVVECEASTERRRKRTAWRTAEGHLTKDLHLVIPDFPLSIVDTMEHRFPSIDALSHQDDRRDGLHRSLTGEDVLPEALTPCSDDGERSARAEEENIPKSPPPIHSRTSSGGNLQNRPPRSPRPLSPKAKPPENVLVGVEILDTESTDEATSRSGTGGAPKSSSGYLSPVLGGAVVEATRPVNLLSRGQRKQRHLAIKDHPSGDELPQSGSLLDPQSDPRHIDDADQASYMGSVERSLTRSDQSKRDAQQGTDVARSLAESFGKEVKSLGVTTSFVSHLNLNETTSSDPAMARSAPARMDISQNPDEGAPRASTPSGVLRKSPGTLPSKPSRGKQKKLRDSSHPPDVALDASNPATISSTNMGSLPDDFTTTPQSPHSNSMMSAPAQPPPATIFTPEDDLGIDGHPTEPTEEEAASPAGTFNSATARVAGVEACLISDEMSPASPPQSALGWSILFRQQHPEVIRPISPEVEPYCELTAGDELELEEATGKEEGRPPPPRAPLVVISPLPSRASSRGTAKSGHHVISYEQRPASPPRKRSMLRESPRRWAVEEELEEEHEEPRETREYIFVSPARRKLGGEPSLALPAAVVVQPPEEIPPPRSATCSPQLIEFQRRGTPSCDAASPPLEASRVSDRPYPSPPLPPRSLPAAAGEVPGVPHPEPPNHRPQQHLDVGERDDPHSFQPRAPPEPPPTHDLQPPTHSDHRPSAHPDPPFQPTLPHDPHAFQPPTHPVPQPSDHSDHRPSAHPDPHPFHPPPSHDPHAFHPVPQPPTHPDHRSSTHPFQPSPHDPHAFQPPTRPIPQPSADHRPPFQPSPHDPHAFQPPTRPFPCLDHHPYQEPHPFQPPPHLDRQPYHPDPQQPLPSHRASLPSQPPPDPRMLQQQQPLHHHPAQLHPHPNPPNYSSANPPQQPSHHRTAAEPSYPDMATSRPPPDSSRPLPYPPHRSAPPFPSPDDSPHIPPRPHPNHFFNLPQTSHPSPSYSAAETRSESRPPRTEPEWRVEVPWSPSFRPEKGPYCSPPRRAPPEDDAVSTLQIEVERLRIENSALRSERTAQHRPIEMSRNASPAHSLPHTAKSWPPIPLTVGGDAGSVTMPFPVCNPRDFRSESARLHP